MSSLVSFRLSSSKAADNVVHIDKLINNAIATNYAVSDSSLEIQFAVNDIGHFLFKNSAAVSLPATMMDRESL